MKSLKFPLTDKSNTFDVKYLKVEKVGKINFPKKIEASPDDGEVLLKSKYMDFDIKCATSFFEFLGLKKIPPKKIEATYHENKLANSYDTNLNEPYLNKENRDLDGLPEVPEIMQERPKGLTPKDVSLTDNSPTFHSKLQTNILPAKSENDSNYDIDHKLW